jgi:hypothetical protein
MIHVFGDSHAMFPWQKVCGVSYNWTKGTAFKFSEHKDSHINISESIFRVRDNDFIIFSFGFLDCKSYIKPISKYFNIKWQDCIDTIAEDYISAIKANKNKINNLQIGILKIPSFVKNRKDLGFDSNYPTKCSNKERKTYTKYFNKKLKYFCDIEKYKFINFFDIYNDEDGYLEKIYTDKCNTHIEPYLGLQNYLLKNFKEHFEKNILYENKTNIGREFVSNVNKNEKGVNYCPLSTCLAQTFFLNNNKIVVF